MNPHFTEQILIVIIKIQMFLSSSMAERSAVNRNVAGSSPAWGGLLYN